MEKDAEGERILEDGRSKERKKTREIKRRSKIVNEGEREGGEAN